MGWAWGASGGRQKCGGRERSAAAKVVLGAPSALAASGKHSPARPAEQPSPAPQLVACLQVCLLVVVDAHKCVPRLGGQIGHQAGLAAAGGALQQRHGMVAKRVGSWRTQCTTAPVTMPRRPTQHCPPSRCCTCLQKDGVATQQHCACQIAQVALNGWGQHKEAAAAVCGAGDGAQG